MLSRLYPINIFVLIGALIGVAGLAVAVFLHSPESKEWTKKLGLSPSFIDATFVDAETGWAVGTFGTVMKTTDSGETWRMQSTDTRAPIRSVHFLDSNTGWAVGAQGVVLFTKDGGQTWDQGPRGEARTRTGCGLAWLHAQNAGRRDVEAPEKCA